MNRDLSGSRAWRKSATSTFDTRMLETLVNLSSEGVWVLDENGNTDLINEPGAAILGFAPDEIIGKRPADIGFLGFDEDAQGVCEDQVERREFRMRRRDGTYIWVSSTARSFHDEDGQHKGSVALFSDVTNEKCQPDFKDDACQKLEVLEGISDGLFALSHDWRFIYLNDIAAANFGKKTRDLLGKMIWEECPELLGTSFELTCREVMESREKQKFETKSLCSDKWFDIRVDPTPSGIMVHWIDVTERRKALKALKEKEAKHRNLFENLHEAVSIFRPVIDGSGEVVDLEWVDANPVVDSIFGLRKGQIIGKRVSQMYRDLGAPATPISAIKEVMATGTSASIEDYHDPLLDRHMFVSVVPLEDGTYGMMAIDITGLKKVQNRAEEQRARLQAILDNTPVAVGVIDTKGGIVLDNGVLKKIWCNEELTLTSVSDYSKCRAWWPETGEPVKPEDWPAARALKGETSTSTFDIEKYDGTRGALIISAAPIRDEAGNITGAVWTNQVISDLRRTEEELKRSNADLQQFAYVASHDLQEPLRMVMAYLGLLIRRHGHELNPKAAEYAKIAMDGAERMRQLIDDLLAYSRIESNKAVRTPVDLNHVARSVVSDLRMAIEEADAEVDVESLPVVYADEAQMVQVLQNLIGNAVKFRGAEPPRVKISSKRRIGEWVISVKDNGIRIDPRHQDDLFKMFHRLHGRAEYPGTGIGLAITKKIVERHGGRIWFESEPGKGTTFHFTMPGMT